jgi:hypothetical protein
MADNDYKTREQQRGNEKRHKIASRLVLRAFDSILVLSCLLLRSWLAYCIRIK